MVGGRPRRGRRGTSALGWVEAAVLLEQIGRHTAPVPFLPSLLALDCAVGVGRAAGTSWVAGLVSGERIGCVGWSRDPDALRRHAGR